MELSPIKDMEKGWRGLPYRPISELYQKRFGGKVYKLPVAVVDDCPNRMGLKGMQTCLFCDVWGSAARAEYLTAPLSKQIEELQVHMQNKYKASMFLVYFQAYTNTFAKITSLQANFDCALKYPAVKGFVLGTRPDCLSPRVLQLWQEYHEKCFVGIELGVQSFFNDDLEFVKRGHTAQQSLKAIEQIACATQVDLGIHLIFGFPGETNERIIETARICNQLPITNVKLHHLHVLKNTGLENLFHQGIFTPVAFKPYAERVRLFLEHLSPRLYVHRLAAFSSRPEELIAPAWTADKMKTHQELIDSLREHHSYQGKQVTELGELEAELKKDLALRARPI